MGAKPIKTLELHYPMITFLIMCNDFMLPALMLKLTLIRRRVKACLNGFNICPIFVQQKLNGCWANKCNLVARVLRLFGQRLVARRDSGKLEFYFRRISAVKQWKPSRSSQSKNLNFFEFSTSLWRPTADQKA